MLFSLSWPDGSFLGTVPVQTPSVLQATMQEFPLPSQFFLVQEYPLRSDQKMPPDAAHMRSSSSRPTLLDKVTVAAHAAAEAAQKQAAVNRIFNFENIRFSACMDSQR